MTPLDPVTSPFPEVVHGTTRRGNVGAGGHARLTESGDVLSVPTHDARFREEPVRTCVGCRQRDHRSVLVRVIVAEVGGAASVVPDPGRRLAGRGAWLHPDPTCLDAAERRRAFSRALRHPGPLELAPLKAYFGSGRLPGSGSVPGQGQLPAPST